MQPTYLPWIGYFSLIDQSDVFVFLDNVEFSKQSWQQRNRIKTANGAQWLTVPVMHKDSNMYLNNVRIKNNSNYVKKHIKSIKQNYQKTPYFDKYFDDLSKIISNANNFLIELNIELIKWICSCLKINTKFIRSSSIRFNEQDEKVEKLVEICKKVNADQYLSPEGSKEYIDENNIFEKNNIMLVYHFYKHPRYKQLYGEFIPYMSCIDLLFNEGEESLKLIRN